MARRRRVRQLRAQTADSVPPLSTNYWRKFGLGVSTSILLHEAGHVLTSIAVGGRPSFGFDTCRPTIYSGLNSHIEPHKQFLFSVAGLTVQNVLDEAILDIPHERGSAFERGILGGGLGTTIFYLTIGRRGSVSDIDFIAKHARHVQDAVDAAVRRRSSARAHLPHVARPALRELLRAAASGRPDGSGVDLCGEFSTDRRGHYERQSLSVPIRG